MVRLLHCIQREALCASNVVVDLTGTILHIRPLYPIYTVTPFQPPFSIQHYASVLTSPVTFSSISLSVKPSKDSFFSFPNSVAASVSQLLG